MHITRIDPTNRRDRRDFLQLPFTIYHDIPQWVPPIMPGERARFRPDFSFYRHSEAAFFLVRDDAGRAVGRIAVLENRLHNQFRQRHDALLYLYEAIQSDEVARLLFDAAADWAQSRRLDTLVGPKGFLTGDGHGLLIEGFEHRPALGIPYNPAYFVDHWEIIAGMRKDIDYLSGRIIRADFTYPERVRRIAEKIRQRRGFRVPVFKSIAEIKTYTRTVQDVYNSTFTHLYAYTPIPDDDIGTVTDNLLQVADPKLIKLIFHEDNLIGFQFAYPDISAALQRIKGRLWPFGFIWVLLEKRRTRWLNVNGMGVLPDYQGSGANAVLHDEMLRSLVDNDQYQFADLVQVQEDNWRMLADLQTMTGAEIYKRHRIYKKQLP